MSFLLRCPNCGVREVTDFGFGGELSQRPRSRPSLRELSTYNCPFPSQRRRRPARVVVSPVGVPRVVLRRERDTRSNVVLWTALPGSEPQAATADGPPAGGGAGA